MRKLLVFILLICACNSYAGWFVFAVNETVERQSAQGWQALNKGDKLLGTDIIRMGQFASLSVLDDKSKRIYTLQTAKETKLAELMQQAQSSCSPNIARYAKTILNIFRSEDTEALSGSAGVNYRDAAADRIVADILRRQMEGYTWSNAPVLKSSYRLDLQMVSAESGEICQVVREGERVRLLVSNHSNRALFVAIVDVDASGIPQVLLPQDASEMISRMFIPAYATVMLPEVLTFAPAGADNLYMFAYEEPFDMQKVLALMPTASAEMPATGAQLGTAQLVIQIR